MQKSLSSKQIRTLRTIIEERYSIDLSRGCREDQFVICRALYFGLARRLFMTSHRELAESLNLKRGRVTHALNEVYPNITKHRLGYKEDEEEIVLELDKRLGTALADTYASSQFKEIFKKINELPLDTIKNIKERFNSILDMEILKVEAQKKYKESYNLKRTL